MKILLRLFMIIAIVSITMVNLNADFNSKKIDFSEIEMLKKEFLERVIKTVYGERSINDIIRIYRDRLPKKYRHKIRKSSKLYRRYMYDLKHNLTKYNISIMKKVFQVVENILPGYGYLAIAISWQESHLGDYCINNKTHDYGIMGINLFYYIKDNKLKVKGYYQKSKLITRLIRDDKLNFKAFKVNFSNWLKIHKKKLWKAVASYNGGYRGNIRYSRQIYNRLLVLRDFLKQEKIELYRTNDILYISLAESYKEYMKKGG